MGATIAGSTTMPLPHVQRHTPARMPAPPALDARTIAGALDRFRAAGIGTHAHVDAPGRGDGAIPAPPKDPNLHVGPLTFNAYGFAVSSAGLVGFGVFRHALKQAGSIPASALPKVIVPAVAAGLVGARLYHVATDWDDYRNNLADIPKMWEGGMAIYGGVAAAALVGAAMARRSGIKVSPLLDAAAIALPVAQAIGRVGNYMNQELYGKPTDAPWGLQVDPEHRPTEFADRNSFHPTFAYEAAWNVALAGGLYGLSKVWKGRPPGALFATYVGGYAAGRFVVEGLRIDESKEFGGLRTNQWTSLGLLGAAAITGATLVLTKGRRAHP